MLPLEFGVTVLALAAGLSEPRVGMTYEKLQSKILELPSDFDAREKFKECSDIIGHVRDQSNCGSCVAMAVIGVFNDRLCIKTGGKFNKLLSPGYAVACCTPDKGCEPPTGCSGATTTEIWDFAQRFGIPTGSLKAPELWGKATYWQTCSGGEYRPRSSMEEADGCFPYNFPPCDHTFVGGKYPACSKVVAETPSCPKTCRNRKYRTKLSKDRHFVAAPGEIDVREDVDEIKREIFVNGSVTALLNVYEDLMAYRSGVYTHKTGSFIESHSVKLIGWGKTATEEYWLAVNSWNEEWGESGLFRIAIGQCGIEKEVTYGVPK